MSETITFEKRIVSGSDDVEQSAGVWVANGTPNRQSEANGAKITFAVTLSAAATEDVILTYSTVNGTAAAGSDFVGISNGQTTIAAGSTSANISIDLINDTITENAEAFTLRLNSAKLATSGSLLTIADATLELATLPLTTAPRATLASSPSATCEAAAARIPQDWPIYPNRRLSSSQTRKLRRRLFSVRTTYSRCARTAAPWRPSAC